jgi:hypothetical protein
MNREIRRQLELAMRKYADCCAFCKKTYPSMSHTYGGTTNTGQFKVACEACKGFLEIHYVMGMYIPKGVTPQQAKTLFESHPMSSLVDRSQTDKPN